MAKTLIFIGSIVKGSGVDDRFSVSRFFVSSAISAQFQFLTKSCASKVNRILEISIDRSEIKLGSHKKIW